MPDRLVIATLYIPKVTGYEHNQEIIDFEGERRILPGLR